MGTWLGGLAAEVKAENKVARIAYVFPDSGGSFPSEAFRQRLRDLGWIEGKNLVLDRYWAAGHLDRFPDLMRQALAQSPDILVTGSTPGALAAKKATTTVPIVVASMGDPVKSGVVTNLAKPGGNLTALSTGYVDGFAGKWLELLLEVAPHATSVAVLWNTDNPVVLPYRGDLEEVARARGVKLNFIDVHQVQGFGQRLSKCSPFGAGRGSGLRESIHPKCTSGCRVSRGEPLT